MTDTFRTSAIASHTTAVSSTIAKTGAKSALGSALKTRGTLVIEISAAVVAARSAPTSTYSLFDGRLPAAGGSVMSVPSAPLVSCRSGEAEQRRSGAAEKRSSGEAEQRKHEDSSASCETAPPHHGGRAPEE